MTLIAARQLAKLTPPKPDYDSVALPCPLLHCSPDSFRPIRRFDCRDNQSHGLDLSF